MTPLYDRLTGARVFDLAQPYYLGMPHFPTHPAYLYSLVKLHGEYVGPAGHSSAADALALGSHVGTHIDALCHFSLGGKLHEGVQDLVGNLSKAGYDAEAWTPGQGHQGNEQQQEQRRQPPKSGEAGTEEFGNIYEQQPGQEIS